MVVLFNVFILRKYMLTYFGAKGHGYSQMVQKNTYIHKSTHIQREGGGGERKQANVNSWGVWAKGRQECFCLLFATFLKV